MISEEEALAEKRTKYQRKRLEARMEEKKSSCTKCNCKDCTSQREDIDAEVSRLRLRHILLEKAIAQLEDAAGVEIEKDYRELIQNFKD